MRKRDENNNKTYTTSTSSSRKKEEDILVTHSNHHHHHTNNNNNNNNILTTATSATNNQQPPYLPHHPQLAGEASDSNRNNNSVSPPGLAVDLSSEAFPTSTTQTTNPNNPDTTITSSDMGVSTAVHLSGVPLDPTKIVRSDFERVPYLTTAKKRKSLRSPSPMLSGKRSLRTSPVEQPPMSQPAQGPPQVVAPRRGLRGLVDNDAKMTSVMGRRTRHSSQNIANSSLSSNSNGSDPAAGATDVGKKRRHQVAMSQSVSGSDSDEARADARKKKRRTNNAKPTPAVKGKGHASPTIVEQLSSKNKAATAEPVIDISKAGLLKLAPIAHERNVFWVKIKGHPYWPAQLVDLDAELEDEPRFQKAQRFSRKGETTCVMYFGTCEVAFVNRERSCIAWDDALVRGIVEVEDRIKSSFKAALHEVAVFCTPTPRFPRGWWNEPDVHKLAANFYERNTESPGLAALSRNKKEYACADNERVMWAKFRGPSYWPVQIIPRNVAAEHRPDLNMDIMDVSQPAVQARKIRANNSDRVKSGKAGASNSGVGADSSSSSSTSDFGGPSMYLPCMFFGTGEVELIAEKNLVPYRAGITRGYLSHNDRHEFLIAVGEAWGYLQEPRIWPSGYISRKTWWNYKSATSTGRRKKRDFNSKRDGNPESGQQRVTYSSSSSLDSAVPDLSLLPHYDHIKKSVWVVEPMPRVKKADITCCECKLDEHGGHNNYNHHHSGSRKDKNNKDDKDIPLTPCCYDASCLNFASNFLCSGSCPAAKGCRNVSFHRRRSPKMTPFFTPDQRGWGIRVDEPVRKGSFVIEYVGEIIDRDILDARLKRMDRENSTEYYMMELTNDLLVDAKFKGNLSRFINSSCDPNCQTQKWTDPVTGQTHVGIFAIQDIVPGTELTYNYCFEDFGLAGKRGKRSFQCMCGTASCMMLEQVERDMLKQLIGQRVEVRWDDGWYPGVVQQYYPQRKRFRVQYDDGDCEDLVLGMPLADKDDQVMYRLVEDDGDSPMKDAGDREESQQKNTGVSNGQGRRKKNAGSNPSSQDAGSYSQNSDVAASGSGKHKAGGSSKGDTVTKGKDGESKKKGKK